MKLNASLTHSNLVHCPEPDCEELLDLNQLYSESTFVECMLEHKFCFRCKNRGWHPEGACNQVNYFLLFNSIRQSY